MAYYVSVIKVKKNASPIASNYEVITIKRLPFSESGRKEAEKIIELFDVKFYDLKKLTKENISCAFDKEAERVKGEMLRNDSALLPILKLSHKFFSFFNRIKYDYYITAS